MEGVTQFNGPNPYTAITAGSTSVASAGGIVVKASDFGLNEIESIIGIPTSQNGLYHLIPLPTTNQNAPQSSIRFVAIITHTGAEVGSTDISGSTFLVRAIGS